MNKTPKKETLKKIFFYLLTLLFIFNSCLNTEELKGIWISSYEVKNEKNSSPKYILFDFENDSVIIKTFPYKTFDQKETIEKIKFHLSGRKLIIKTDTVFIEKISHDSLVLSYEDLLYNEKVKLIFKKITKYEKYKDFDYNLTGKKYEITSDIYDDIFSYEFINDSTYVNLNSDTIENCYFGNWSISKYKNLSFLILDDINSPPQLIKDIKNNKFSTKLFTANEINYKYNKSNTRKTKTTSILGNWTTSKDYNFPIFIPKTSIDYKDKNIYFTFLENNLSIKQFDITQNYIVEYYGHEYIILKDISNNRRKIWPFSFNENGNIKIKISLDYFSKSIEIELKRK